MSEEETKVEEAVQSAPKSIKFSEDELRELVDLKQKYHTNLLGFGDVKLRTYMIEDEIANLKEREDKLKQEHLDLQNEEKGILDKITHKYGEGSLDIQSGVFTPTAG